MDKKWKGYFTIEAALIMPLILFLYVIIILTALFLYCRCAISQDNFLLGMRAAGFSYGEDNYGEIIYGEYENNPWTPDSYV
ncbi:MAG: pilus assembly protein, partial [Lachnospiraceae bacterium]|nr:pilus assembly protein [Lachnospiraceae bacterium]